MWSGRTPVLLVVRRVKGTPRYSPSRPGGPLSCSTLTATLRIILPSFGGRPSSASPTSRSNRSGATSTMQPLSGVRYGPWWLRLPALVLAPESAAAGDDDRLRPVAGVELGENVGHMVAHRLRSEHEFARDRLVVEAAGHQFQDVSLTAAQLRERRGHGRGAQLGELGHGACDALVEDDVSGHHRVDDVFDVSRVGAFDDIPAGAVAYRRDRRMVVLGHGEHDDLHTGMVRREPPVHL